MLDCEAKPSPVIALDCSYEQWFDVKTIKNDSVIELRYDVLEQFLSKKDSKTFSYDIRLPNSPSISYWIQSNITLYRCRTDSDTRQMQDEFFSGYKNYSVRDQMNRFTIYYRNPRDSAPKQGLNGTIYYRNPRDSAPKQDLNGAMQTACSVLTFPVVSADKYPENDLFQLLSADFDLHWHLAEDCYACHNESSKCPTEWSHPWNPRCARKGNNNTKVILSTVIPIGAFVAIVLVLLIWHRKKKMNCTSYFRSRTASELSLNQDPEAGSVYFGVPVFSYSELEEATNNFDASRELGDGGFGTVYCGKLRDGREVAVKRLYEHNFKRMEQFMNEIKILTRLRHRNLVSLYGCTSRRSRELLLVYEYIPNGTVADHLHGDRAKDKHLTWQHRMNVAIETADALAHLHKSDIIHRDVKTNNILLDHNFCVKVADFGLSRLFPTDVTHVSTAPQGTPGYVDPEYHQCYQLTDKSDVYSFGVVLIELISSMPAVDISRHRHEINLANLAINRIQRCAFDELIDPSLGYKSDAEIMRITTSVAELAFRCLQLEKDMRPNMEEVLETLKEIQNCKDSSNDMTNGSNEKAVESRRAMASSPETEDIVLLKNAKIPSSPNCVADVWVSSSSTTSTSR